MRLGVWIQIGLILILTLMLSLDKGIKGWSELGGEPETLHGEALLGSAGRWVGLVGGFLNRQHFDQIKLRSSEGPRRGLAWLDLIELGWAQCVHGKEELWVCFFFKADSRFHFFKLIMKRDSKVQPFHHREQGFKLDKGCPIPRRHQRLCLCDCDCEIWFTMDICQCYFLYLVYFYVPLPIVILIKE